MLGIGARQVAGLLGEGPHPAGGRARMMGRESLPRDEEGYEGKGEWREPNSEPVYREWCKPQRHA